MELRTAANSHKEVTIASEEVLMLSLQLERRRTERSQRAFVLMLLTGSQINADSRGFPSEILLALTKSIRETDCVGWYRQSVVPGVVFTEISADRTESAIDAIQARMTGLPRCVLDFDEANRTHLEFSCIS